jgi:hypothetical protein
MSWLETSIKKSKILKDHYKLRGVDIFIKDALSEDIDFDFVVRYVAARLPEHLFSNVDIIYVGRFQDLIDREVNAAYEHGAIYITNEQDSEMDIIDDLIHEIAHSNEPKYQDVIYGDKKLEAEFLAKRKALYNILKRNKKYRIPIKFLVDPGHSQEIDDFLYKDVTYNALWQMVPGIFPSPYAATSLREYYARGFEEYFMGEKQDLKQICPVLYYKMQDLENVED